MTVVIAGSRSITEARHVADAVRASGFVVSEVVSGTAAGIDRLGEQWAASHGVPVRRFPADWARYGRRGGVVRNLEMARYAAASPAGGALVAVWDGVSNGTRYMIDFARQHGLAIYVHTVRAGRVP